MHLNALQNGFQPPACRVYISTRFNVIRLPTRHPRA
jgi:hypothetical protein